MEHSAVNKIHDFTLRRGSTSSLLIRKPIATYDCVLVKIGTNFHALINHGQTLNLSEHLIRDEDDYIIVARWDESDDLCIKWLFIQFDDMIVKRAALEDEITRLKRDNEILQELLDRPSNAGSLYGWEQCEKLLQ